MCNMCVINKEESSQLQTKELYKMKTFQIDDELIDVVEGFLRDSIYKLHK